MSAGNRGHLGDCLVRGQDCQLGQEGLVDQGAPSLQEAHVALVAPRDLQWRTKALGKTGSYDVTERGTMALKARGVARDICPASDKSLDPQSSWQVNGTAFSFCHRDSRGRHDGDRSGNGTGSSQRCLGTQE